MNDNEAMTIKPIFRVTQIIWYVLDILEIFLVFRLVLKFIGADPAAGFTHFIYAVTAPVTQPFINVFQGPQIFSGGYFEWTTLLAMIVYWLAALAVVRVFLMLRPVSTYEARQRLRAEE